MQTETTPPQPRNTRRAIALLIHAARSEHQHVYMGGAWLIVAALFGAAGPLLGKYFIDHSLLPRRFDLLEMGLLLGGILFAGAVASVVRYIQLTRLAGVAMRSVRRLRADGFF